MKVYFVALCLLISAISLAAMIAGVFGWVPY